MRLGRRATLAAVACCVAGTGRAAPPLDDLYSGRAITTGMDLRGRAEGLERCLRATLVKVSGNPALATDPRVPGLVPDPAALLGNLVYLDRMSDLPHQDEQGSRDRPYDLQAWFVPARIDAVLVRLGEAPWLAPRPRLAVEVEMQRGGSRYRLLGDGDADERPRGALLAAADRYGLHVVLPLSDHTGAVDGVPVSGTVVWNDAEFGWVGQWSLAWQGRPCSWRIAGVSFDEAFRNLLAGALQILSGHGAPV